MYQGNMMNNFTAFQPITMIQQSNLSTSQVIQFKFFYYTPDDNKFYHVTCQIIRGSVLDDHDYDHGFFYYGSTINYFVKCHLFSHHLIMNILNKEIYGMDVDTNNFERKKPLSLDQKASLERDLKQVLPFYFMQNHLSIREMRMDPIININPSLQGRNTEQMISIDGNQNNFGNDNGFYQNGVVDYHTCNITQPQQQIDSHNISDFNTNSFHRNIGNNVMAASIANNQNSVNKVESYNQVELNNMSPTEREVMPVYTNRNTSSSNENIENNLITKQMTSMVDNQKSCLPPQNRVEDIQQADFNNFLCQIPERETISDYNRNINSPQSDIVTHDVSMTDINFHHRDTCNACLQQQTDLNIPAERITTQDIPITDVNQNYDDNIMPYNDSHNVNINSPVTSS
jgi:hypothetical protein